MDEGTPPSASTTHEPLVPVSFLTVRLQSRVFLHIPLHPLLGLLQNGKHPTEFSLLSQASYPEIFLFLAPFLTPATRKSTKFRPNPILPLPQSPAECASEGFRQKGDPKLWGTHIKGPQSLEGGGWTASGSLELGGAGTGLLFLGLNKGWGWGS